MCAAIIHIFNIKKKQNKLKPIYLKFNLRKTCCCQQVTRRQVHKWLSRICPAANEQFNNIVRFQQAGRGVVFHIFLRFLFWPLNFYFFSTFFFLAGGKRAHSCPIFRRRNIQTTPFRSFFSLKLNHVS